MNEIRQICFSERSIHSESETYMKHFESEEEETEQKHFQKLQTYSFGRNGQKHKNCTHSRFVFNAYLSGSICIWLLMWGEKARIIYFEFYCFCNFSA